MTDAELLREVADGIAGPRFYQSEFAAGVLRRIADDLERRARETKRMVADYEAGKIEARRTP